MTEASDQVRSLLQGMREAARAYDIGDLPLDRLVWELKSRISAMEGLVDPEWVEELRSTWGQLEYLNAFWIENGRLTLDAGERRDVSEALEGLLSMLVEY